MSHLVAFIKFFFFYILEVTKSNITIALCALNPHYKIDPGFVDIPLETKSDFQTLLLANLITMTPGTITVDVSENRKTITIHFMFRSDRNNLTETFNKNFYSIFGKES